MTDEQQRQDEQKETAKEELESEWSGSGVAFIGVGLGASIVLTTLIILSAISYAITHDSVQVLEAIFSLIR